MAKILLDKAQKIDITAKSKDNFSVTFNIVDAENNSEVFNEDKITSAVFRDYINGTELSEAASSYVNFSGVNGYVKNSIIKESVLLFTITKKDDTPVLAACSSQLDLAMYHTALGIPAGINSIQLGKSSQDDYNDTSFTYGNYYESTIQNEFDKFLTRQHYNKIKGVAKVLSTYSNKNTLLEKSNYNLNNINFYQGTSLETKGAQLQTIQHHLEAGVTDDFMDQSEVNDKEIWFYNIFTNQF